MCQNSVDPAQGYTQRCQYRRCANFRWVIPAPTVLGRLPQDELSPISGMIEQDWLLRGTPVSHVLCGLDRKPTRLVCPDPLLMALHKTWLSQQPKRRVDRRPKDAAQGQLLFAAVKTRMPHYPLDESFQAELPAMLRPVFVRLAREFAENDG